VPYALVDVELTAPLPAIRLGPDETGVGLVSRRDGRVVGYALHALPAGSVLEPDDVQALLDPDPVVPAVLHGDGDAPSITVVVCTHDRAELLDACLTSVGAMTQPPDELLVVDNAPSDGATRRVAERHGARHVVEPCPGLDMARNRALRVARGEVVAFVDDDVLVDRFWLQALRETLRANPDAGGVMGQILPVELTGGAQIAFERVGGFRGGNQTVRHQLAGREDDPVFPYGPGAFGAGANMAVRRRLALELGGFDEALDTGAPLPGGGDIDMTHRVVRSGHVLVYEPRVVVFHRHRPDDAALARQFRSWGESTLAFVAKTYRRDPGGRRKLRNFLRWYGGYLWRGVRHPAVPEERAASLAQARGVVAGTLGVYGRSRRLMARRRRRSARPSVAVLVWGDVIEDYLDGLGLTIDDFAQRQTGGWLFGYVEALDRQGVDTVIVVWSRAVRRPERRLHVPTGSVLWVLPPGRLLAGARTRIAERWAWDVRSATGGRPRRRPLGAVAWELAPYLSTRPVQLARVLRAEGCRAVLSQEYEEGRFDVAVAVGRLLRLPVFATFQGGDHTRTHVERRIRSRAMRAAAGFAIADGREAARVTSAHGVDPARVARIPNPFDPAELPVVVRDDARRALGIDPATPVVVWHGRVDVHSKGLDVLADAWPQVVAAQASPPLLLLLGTGHDAPRLHERFRPMVTAGTVRWRDEYVLDRKVIATHLGAGDLYVLPSRQEGFPVAPVEAMATGLPVVAADAPGVRAVLGEGDDAAGLIVPVDDAEALAVALLSLLDDDGERARLGAQARRRVAGELSLDSVGERLRALLLPDGAP